MIRLPFQRDPGEDILAGRYDRALGSKAKAAQWHAFVVRAASIPGTQAVILRLTRDEIDPPFYMWFVHILLPGTTPDEAKTQHGDTYVTDPSDSTGRTLPPEIASHPIFEA